MFTNKLWNLGFQCEITYGQAAVDLISKLNKYSLPAP
jgi:hypothetical protein